jgi:hypothetical protein
MKLTPEGQGLHSQVGDDRVRSDAEKPWKLFTHHFLERIVEKSVEDLGEYFHETIAPKKLDCFDVK